MASDSSSISTMPVEANSMGCSGRAERTSPMRWRRRDEDIQATSPAITMPTSNEAPKTPSRLRSSAVDEENSASWDSSPMRAQCSEANGDVLS